jgi:hypothetical protein
MEISPGHGFDEGQRWQLVQQSRNVQLLRSFVQQHPQFESAFRAERLAWWHAVAVVATLACYFGVHLSVVTVERRSARMS